MISRRLLAASAALVLSAFALTACAASAGEVAPAAPAPSDPSAPPSTGEEGETKAAWLDEGRMLAVITWGSSGCIPLAEAATAEGQTISVELVDDADQEVCTADYAPRASLVGVPEGVDPTEDVVLEVTYGDAVSTVEVDGDDDLAGVPGESTEYSPSAGWYDESGFAILTWGSSTCAPAVEAVEPSGGEAITVTFVEPPADQACTMDMAPRVVLTNAPASVDDDDVTLTLVGDSIDATVQIRGDR